MLRVIIKLVGMREVVYLKKKNDNFRLEIVKYRFAGKLNASRKIKNLLVSDKRCIFFF